MNKYTSLPEEIQGTNNTFKDTIINYTLATVVALVIGFFIADAIFGAETVSEVMGEVFYWVAF